MSKKFKTDGVIDIIGKGKGHFGFGVRFVERETSQTILIEFI